MTLWSWGCSHFNAQLDTQIRLVFLTFRANTNVVLAADKLSPIASFKSGFFFFFVIIIILYILLYYSVFVFVSSLTCRGWCRRPFFDVDYLLNGLKNNVPIHYCMYASEMYLDFYPEKDVMCWNLDVQSLKWKDCFVFSFPLFSLVLTCRSAYAFFSLFIQRIWL